MKFIKHFILYLNKKNKEDSKKYKCHFVVKKTKTILRGLNKSVKKQF